jgi:branched-chain amino acid transport system substrate-binding protein
MAAGLATVLVLSGAACAKQDSGTGTTAQIPIGVDIELSGTAQVQGEAYRNALNLIAKQINKKGLQVDGQTKKIKLIIRDNKSDPAQSLTVAKGLIDNDKVAAIIGAGASPTTMSIVQTVEQDKVPLVSMGSSGAIVSPPAERKYIFKTPANTPVTAQVMLDRFKKVGIKKIAVLSVNNAYGDAGLKAWQDLAGDGKIQLVGNQKFDAAAKDLTVPVTNLVDKNPDAVVVWAIPPQAGIAAQDLRNAKFDPGKVYFDTGAGAELFVKGAGKDAEGMFMVHSRVLAGDQITATTPGAQAEKTFFTDYSRAYGNFSGFAPFAADALTAIADAIDKSGKDDRESIRNALENLSFDGANGSYQFSANNHGGVGADSLALLTVKNGTWTLPS